jgi:hypothetical protein
VVLAAAAIEAVKAAVKAAAKRTIVVELDTFDIHKS